MRYAEKKFSHRLTLIERAREVRITHREELERVEEEYIEVKEKVGGLWKKLQTLEKSVQRAKGARDMVVKEKEKRDELKKKKEEEGDSEEKESADSKPAPQQKGGKGKKKGKGDLSGVNDETLLKMLDSKQRQVDKAQQQLQELEQSPPFQLYYEKKRVMEEVRETTGWTKAKGDIDALLKGVQGRRTLHQHSGRLFESAAQEFAEGLAVEKGLLTLPNLSFENVQLPDHGATGEFDFVVVDAKSEVNEVKYIIECKRNIVAVVRDLKKKLKAGEFFCGNNAKKFE